MAAGNHQQGSREPNPADMTLYKAMLHWMHVEPSKLRLLRKSGVHAMSQKLVLRNTISSPLQMCYGIAAVAEFEQLKFACCRLFQL